MLTRVLHPTGALTNPEIPLAAAVAAIGLLAAWFRWRRLGWWERPVARLARRKGLAIAAVALAPLLIRAALLPWFPAPQPSVHDEFSFLLAADTFSHGRLVNPQHPFWVHFESIHILTHPVYASPFPVAPAVFLSLGMLLFGHPWAGVMLGVGFMCGATCWMLQGWVPPRWALLGACLLALRLGVSSYWMNSYWGGAVAAAGGALALGALPRLLRKPDWRYAVVLGAGFAILGHSRPYEGAVLALLITATLLYGRKVPLRRVVLPFVLVMAVAAGATGWYFYRVTGNPLRLPYSLYRSTLTLAPHFVWQQPRAEPLYNNAEMRGFYTIWEMHAYALSHRPWRDLQQKLGSYWRFYLGPLLTIPLFAAPMLRRNRQARLALLMAGTFALALAPEVWHYPHYAAPATSLAMVVAIFGMRRLRLWAWRGRPVGLAVVRLLPTACAGMLLIQIAAGIPPAIGPPQQGWRWAALDLRRAAILQQLRDTPGAHLVFVRYALRHDPGDEWVYNEADIDAARVVWARELDPQSNAKLMRYFDDRRVWLVEPDLPSPHLVAYANAPFRPMPFVPLGAPGIEALRRIDDLGSTILAKAGRARFSCDVWNYFFTQATGIAGPDAAKGCFTSDRAEPVSFEQWFSWLRRQK